MSAERADQPVPDRHGIPGKTLAAQREAMGWTVEQVADQLKLAVRQVIALEEGDYANLPGPAVVRGFVRAYAKVVKLDAAPLVAQIALDTPAAADTSATLRRDRPAASFSQVRFPTNGKRASKLPWVGLAALVLIVGAAGTAWQMGLLQTLSLPGLSPAATVPVASAPNAAVTVLPPPVVAGDAGVTAPAPGQAPVPTDAARATEPHPPVISNPVPLISVPPPSTPSGAGTAANPAAGIAPGGVAGVAPAPAAPAPAVPAAPSSNALVLTVREDSWIEVRQPKGPKLFSGLVKAGSIETVTVTGPATLIVGRPGAVDATLRGQPVALPADVGGRVARVNLQ